MTPDTLGSCESCGRDVARDDPDRSGDPDSGAAMCGQCVTDAQHHAWLERKRHVGRLLLQAKTHAAPLALVHSAWCNRGPDALKDAEWDAQALMLALDALHAELAATA